MRRRNVLVNRHLGGADETNSCGLCHNSDSGQGSSAPKTIGSLRKVPVLQARPARRRDTRRLRDSASKTRGRLRFRRQATATRRHDALQVRLRHRVPEGAATSFGGTQLDVRRSLRLGRHRRGNVAATVRHQKATAMEQ
ncbi:unnamed protein product [Ixodes hexagonus]